MKAPGEGHNTRIGVEGVHVAATVVNYPDNADDAFGCSDSQISMAWGCDVLVSEWSHGSFEVYTGSLAVADATVRKRRTTNRSKTRRVATSASRELGSRAEVWNA